MKRIIPALLLMLVASFVTAQNSTIPRAAPSHFRWSERQAHELDYNRTIRNSTALTLVEKKSLIDLVVQTLKRDDKDMTEDERFQLASETRIEFVDLNGDGRPEIIAQANGLGPCGGTGNCIFWIFQLTPNGTSVLFDSTLAGETIYELVTVRPWRTNGFNDIVLASHSSATARNIVWLRYANGSYRPSACYYLSWIGDHGESLKIPDISSSPCEKPFGLPQ
jgi:hypothetical protein